MLKRFLGLEMARLALNFLNHLKESKNKTALIKHRITFKIKGEASAHPVDSVKFAFYKESGLKVVFTNNYKAYVRSKLKENYNDESKDKLNFYGQYSQRFCDETQK